MSKREAMARLPSFRATTYKRTLLFYAEPTLAFEDVAEMINDLHEQLPQWDILLITPNTTKPCQQWLDAHSGPVT